MLLLLIIASITDWRKGIIPNSLVLSGMVLAIAEHVAFQGVQGLLISLIGGAVWLLVGWLLWMTRKFGGGDGKLFAMIGTFTGVSGVPNILMAALVAQSIIYLITFARGHMKLDQPFAPAIASGSVMLMVWSIWTYKMW